ncbi:MAG TPA: hypothetical protein VF376_05620 [Thermoanaerobaculia bacterium]
MRVLKEGVAYFGVVFGIGFVLGTIRTLLVVPRVGAPAAELMETPIMLGVTFFAARWVVRRFAIPPGIARRFSVGLVGTALLIAAEFTLVLRLRGLTIREYEAGHSPTSQIVYLLSLGAVVIMPIWVDRR